jgi:hypothetical protein
MTLYRIRGNYGIVKREWVDPNAIVHMCYAQITLAFLIRTR